MTLVVARADKGRLAIVADTLVSAHGSALGVKSWTLKTRCLTENICVSFSGSPELAAQQFKNFRSVHNNNATFSNTVSFFEKSSLDTGNEYIIAFSNNAKLVTIRDGRRSSGLSRTHWIGDKAAFEKFRQWEHSGGLSAFKGRAIQAALFADEMAGSPASDLYSILRNVIADRSVITVGGMVTVLSNRDFGFRFSVYSDVLYDWPISLPAANSFRLEDKIDLVSSGENNRYSLSQISPGYYSMNAVAFYLLSGKLLIFLGEDLNSESYCLTFKDVEPGEIAYTLNQHLGFDFKALALVASARREFQQPIVRTKNSDGVTLGLYIEANTMPKNSN